MLSGETRTTPTGDLLILDAGFLLDTATWKVVRDDLVVVSGFSPDGRRFLTRSPGTLAVRDAETGLPVGAEIPFRGGIDKIVYSPDGRRVLAIDDERHGQLWDLESGVPVARDIRFTGTDPGLFGGNPTGAFAPDGRHFAVWAGNQARVWDVTAGRPVTPLLVHPTAVVSAEFSPDGFHLLTGCADGTVRLWPATAGEPPARHIEHYPNPLVHGVTFHPDGVRLSATLTFIKGRERNSPGGVLLWDGERASRLPDAWTTGGAFPYATDAAWARVVCWDNNKPRTGRVFDLATRRQSGLDLHSEGPVETTGFSPDGATVWAISRPDQSPGAPRVPGVRLYLWDAASGEPRTTAQNQLRGQGYQAVFARDGAVIVVPTNDGIGAWETATGRPAGDALPEGAKSAVAVPGGRGLVVTLADGGTLLWDAATGRATGPALRLPGEAVRDPKSGGLWTLERNDSDAVRVARPRDPRTGEPIGPPARLPDGWVAWPEHGLGYSVVRGHGATIHLLDRATGRPTGAVLRHADRVEFGKFSDDGRVAFTATKSGRTRRGYNFVLNGSTTYSDVTPMDVRLWDVAAGEPLGPPLRHLFAVGNVPRLAPVGATVLTCPNLDEVLLVDFVPDPRPAEVLARVAEALSGRRLADGWEFVPLDRAAHQTAWGELPSLLPPTPDAQYRPAGWHRGQARAASRDGDLRAARFHLDRLVALTPADAAAHRDLAAVAIQQKDQVAGAVAAERATALDPANADGWVHRGQAAANRGQWKAAGDAYLRVTETATPNTWQEEDAWRYYLFSRALANDPPAYRAARAALLTKYAGRGHPRLILRWVTLRPGGVDDVTGLIRKVEEAAAKEPQGAKYDLSVLALAHLRTGNFATALDTTNDLESRFPADFLGHDRLARVIALARLGRVAEARVEFQRARDWGARCVHRSEPAPETGQPVPYSSKLAYLVLLSEAEALAGGQVTTPKTVDDARQTAASWERAVAAEPKEPAYRAKLANSLAELGDRLRAQGDKASGDEEHRKALVVRQKLAADSPDDPARRTDVGWAFVRAGDRARADGKPAVALDEYTKAITAAGPVVEKTPSFDPARLCLRQAHWVRGIIRADAGKHAEAVHEFSRALELSTGGDRIDPQSFRALNRFHAGQAAEALRDADDLAKEGSPLAAYNAACVYSLASGKFADKKAEYGDRAVELLRRSLKAGFQNTPLLKTDTDLNPLRDRGDFKSLLADLERKFPSPREVAPPPREKK